MIEQDLADVSLPAPQFTPSPPSEEGSGLARFEHRIEATYNAQRYDNDIQARSVALSTATDFRNKDILRETGATLENPLEGGYKAEALERVAKSGQAAYLPAVQARIYQEKLDALASQYPDKAAAIGANRPILQDAKRMADYWADRAARGEPGLSATANFVGGLIGGAAGFIRSPMNATLMLIGGGEMKAATVVGKMAEGFVREGLVNAGLQAVAEPGVQAWRAERGREHGVLPALEDVGAAVLFGGGFGAGAQAVKAGATAVAARFLSRPEKGITEAAATPLAQHAPQLRAAARAVDADAAALADAPTEARGVDAAVAQAIRHGEGLDDALPELMTGPASDADARAALAIEPGAQAAETDAHAVAIEQKAREISPKPFAHADELDNRIAGARAEIARAAEEAAGGDQAGQLQTRIAGLQGEFDAITGKRRSSPRAKALRQEIADLTAQSAALLDSAQARAAERMQTLRMALLDAQNERALLGPKLLYVRNHAAGMLGIRMQDLPVKDATVTAERLRRAPPLIWSALASDAPDLKAAGRLASLGDAAFDEARNGAVDVNVALATAARVVDQAEQLAVMRGAQATRPRDAAEAAAAVSLEMETRATPAAQMALLGASEAHAQVPASRFARENAAAATAQIEELTAALTEATEPGAAARTFKTAKGSSYVLHEDGTTSRDKAARSDAGHEGDSGPKPRTERTVYVATTEAASALSGAGITDSGGKGFRLAIKDGKATLLSWNKDAKRWGAAPSSRDVPVMDTPSVGAAPLELWGKANDVPGYEAYKRQHAGNKIVELSGAEEKPNGAAPTDLLDLVPRDDGLPLPIEDVLKERPREELLSLLVKDCDL